MASDAAAFTAPVPAMHSLAHDQGVVEGVGAEEVLRVVVCVDDDLACMHGRPFDARQKARGGSMVPIPALQGPIAIRRISRNMTRQVLIQAGKHSDTVAALSQDELFRVALCSSDHTAKNSGLGMAGGVLPSALLGTMPEPATVLEGDRV